MNTQELTVEAYTLLREKGWECTPELLTCFHQVCARLTEEGVRVDREMIDFVLDVIYVKTLVGLSPEASDEEIEVAKEMMVEWLEALGWRRAWFLRPLRRLH